MGNNFRIWFNHFYLLLFLYYARHDECMSILACTPISTRFSLVSFVLSGFLSLLSMNIKSKIEWAKIIMTFFYRNYIALNIYEHNMSIRFFQQTKKTWAYGRLEYGLVYYYFYFYAQKSSERLEISLMSD